MRPSEGVNKANDTRAPQTHAEGEHAGHQVTLATLAPPPTAPRVGVGTPDFDGDFRIICRGDEYGSMTRVALRQITESTAVHDRFSGVAVELESVFGFSDKSAVVSRLISDLHIPGINVAETVPPFVSVPRPDITVLFLTSADPATTPSEIAKSIQEHLSSLNSPSAHRERTHGNLGAGKAEDTKHVNLSSIFSEAGVMADRLKATATFSKWRPIHWTSLQVAATEALRPMLTGATAEDCTSIFNENFKRLATPRVTTSQRALVTTEFVATATELAGRQAAAVSI